MPLKEKKMSSANSSTENEISSQDHQPTALRTRSQTLRILAISILILGVIDTVFGGLLLNENTNPNNILGIPNHNIPFSVGYLGLHIGVGVLIVALAMAALTVSLRSPRSILFNLAISPRIHRVLSGVIFGAALGAAISGGFSFGLNLIAIDSMEVFADIMLIGPILLIIFGSVPKSNPSA